MKVIRFADAESYEPEKDWKRASLCAEEQISVEHFVKPAGHDSPLHDHPSAQVLVVISGKLSVTVGEATETLGEGDAVFIPGSEPHVVGNPGETPSSGLDIFVPGRSFDFWLKRKAGS
ncbi:MAG: cupin domain-containing protein [Planctomycetota bacterium]|jgi:quercetin dioxygenase-like cupin family protein